jgi:hypothetical protein
MMLLIAIAFAVAVIADVLILDAVENPDRVHRGQRSVCRLQRRG